MDYDFSAAVRMPASMYLIKAERVAGRILYRIEVVDKWDNQLAFKEDGFRFTVKDSSAVSSYPCLNSFHIILPGIIKSKRVGQMVNPTRLLRQHLALQKEQSNEST